LHATTRFVLAGLLGAALLCGAPRGGLRADEPDAPTAPPRSKNAWTLDEARAQLKLNPRDPYLQYVVLQLARREARAQDAGGGWFWCFEAVQQQARLDEIADEVEKLAFGGDRDGRAARRDQVDLFGLFAGSLAVQEGLQLDTMRGRPAGVRVAPATETMTRAAAPEAVPPPPPPDVEETGATPAPSTPSLPGPPSSPSGTVMDGPPADTVKDGPPAPDDSVLSPEGVPGSFSEILSGTASKSLPSDQPPVGVPCKLVMQWQPRLVETQDTVNGGVPLRGFGGRVFLVSDLTMVNRVTCEGTLTIDLYDDRPLAKGQEPVRLERWIFADEALKLLVRKDATGWGYTLFLPWVKTYRPEVTPVHLRASFTPHTKDGETVYDTSPSIALEQAGKPLPQSATQETGGKARGEADSDKAARKGTGVGATDSAPACSAAEAPKATAPAAPQLPPKMGMNKSPFWLPINVDDRTRSTLREFHLYIKDGPSRPWDLQETRGPDATLFKFSPPRDGEYWFRVVTLDKYGRESPADISDEAPDVIVIFDTQPPQVDVRMLIPTPDCQRVHCRIRDRNPDPSKTRFEYQTLDQSWHAGEPASGKMDTFLIPLHVTWTWKVRVTAWDLAGNQVTREVNLKDTMGEKVTPDPRAVFVNPTDPAEDRDAVKQVAERPASPSPSLKEVAAMKKAGVGDRVLINAIRQSPARYRLSASDIIWLREGDISDAVISAMQDHDPAGPAVTRQPATGSESEPPPMPPADASERSSPPASGAFFLVGLVGLLGRPFSRRRVWGGSHPPQPGGSVRTTPRPVRRRAGMRILRAWLYGCVAATLMAMTACQTTPTQTRDPDPLPQGWSLQHPPSDTPPMPPVAQAPMETGLTLPTGWQNAQPPQYNPPAPSFTLTSAEAEAIQLPTEEPEAEKIPAPPVSVSDLKGPTIKSHPWTKMLAGRSPKVSDLSRCVPHDFYFVEFRSVSKLLDLIDSADQWSTFIYSQSVKDARSQQVGRRLQKQLVLETGGLPRAFTDAVIDGIALTGSDLFVREGSDVTVLLQFHHEKLFKQGVEKLLARAEQSRPDVTRTTGKILGVDYVQLATPGREISVFAAYPKAGLHVRSNSKVGLRRVLEAVRGSTAAGKAVRRLGETDEYKYVRTLMPQGAKEEDGFIYLSDAFVRHMVGPRLKLTEVRRLQAYNHLRMLAHAAQLYRTEQGKAPASLEALAAADCCPGKFNEGALAAPDGGTYSLAADGASGISSRHGTVRFLTPCCEIPVKHVTADEAAAYEAFLEQYNQYWRTYFDPVAIRVQVQPKRVRLETIVLPLMDNTVYTMLSKVLGGRPERLDKLPVPKRNIFSVNVRLNKEELLKGLLKDFIQGMSGGKTGTGTEGPSPEEQLVLKLPKFLERGVGNQVGLHVYDQGVPFDINLATLLGRMVGSFNGTAESPDLTANLGIMAIAIPVGACTAPGYLSFTVKDEKVVDDFLACLDRVVPPLAAQLTGDIGFTIEGDYYKLKLKGGVTAYSFALRAGPARFRLHLARIGKGLYLTNHAPVLEDIWAAGEAEKQAKTAARPDRGPKAHALVRMRARNWDQALPGFRLSWAENNRQSCLANLPALSGIARALTAQAPGEEDRKNDSWDDRRVQDHAARVYGTHHVCPDGGRYVLAPDGKSVVCTVHGSALDARQTTAPAPDSPTARLMRDFQDLSAALTFTPEGLRAVLTIDRK
jgi:hypothetical protein